MGSVDETKVASRYKAAKQGHVLKYLDTLSDEAKDKFLEQLDSIKVEDISSLLEAALADQNEDGEDEIAPFSNEVGETTDKDGCAKAYERGVESISKGEVAAVVLAGGQGTRLGFSGPKGMYDIGLPSGRTLFQLLAERLKRLKQVAKTDALTTERLKKLKHEPKSDSLPFYIMTSPINHEETVNFFKENNYFGLPEEDVLFFQQGMLPCMEDDGKIILEKADLVAMAPDG